MKHQITSAKSSFRIALICIAQAWSCSSQGQTIDFCNLGNPLEFIGSSPMSIAALFPGNSSVEIKDRNIIIDGTLNIDKNTRFLRCTIRMKQASTINVVGNVKFTSQVSNFGRCGQETSNGIRVSSSASIWFINSTMDGAVNGLNFRFGFDQANTIIMNSTISNCINGINIGTNNNQTTKFTTKGLLNNTVQRCTTGIRIFGALGKINGFKLLRNNTGMQIDQSELAITKISIDAITTSVVTPILGNSSGIISDKSALNISESTFKNLDNFGVSSTAFATIKVSKCTLENITHFSLRCRPAAQGLIEITENDFFLNNSQTGPAGTLSGLSAIIVETDHQVVSTNPNSFITHNYIEINLPTLGSSAPISQATGIAVLKAGLGGMEISHNGIHVNAFNTQNFGGGIGLMLKGVSSHPVENYHIEQNEINFTAIPFDCGNRTFGIATFDCFGINSTIRSNIISSSHLISKPSCQSPLEAVAASMTCGVHVERSTDLHICENIFNGSGRGVHFEFKPFGFVDLARNDFNHHGFGVALREQDADIGNQRWHENTWIDDPMVYIGIGNRGATGLGNPFPFKFFWEGMPLTSGLTYNAPNANFSGQWFVNLTKGPGDQSSSDCIKGFIDTPEFNDTDKETLSGLSEFLYPSEIWDNKRRLLSKFIEFPATIAKSSSAVSFINTENSSSTSLFASAMDNLRQIVEFSSQTDSVQCQFLQSNFLNITDSIIIITNALENAPDSVAIENLYARLIALQTQLEFYAQNKAAFDASIASEAYSKLMSFNSTVSSLPEGTSQELTNKRLLQLMSKTVLDTLNETEMSEVRAIASGCFDTLGQVVFDAQSLLPFNELMNHICDDCISSYICGSQERGQDKPVVRTAQETTIFPNPVFNDELYLRINETGLGGAKIEISNMTGRVYLTESFDESNFANPLLILNIKPLPSGWYTAKVIVGKTNNALNCHKFYKFDY